MGEPLDNYDEVSKSIRGMHNRAIFNLAENHITVSTVGVVKRMKQFTDEFPRVNLALSLHAPTQEIRKKIVPTSTANTMPKLLDALRYHISKTQNRVFIEYITIGNVNASEECAHQLARLFQEYKHVEENGEESGIPGDKLIINLIPYNPTDIGDKYSFESPSTEQLEKFKQAVMSYGLFCTVRKSTTSGQDIDGACGQLALRGAEKKDLEDLMSNGSNENGQKKKKIVLKKNKMGAAQAPQPEELQQDEKKTSATKKKIVFEGDKRYLQFFQMALSFGIMVVMMTLFLKYVLHTTWEDLLK